MKTKFKAGTFIVVPNKNKIMELTPSTVKVWLTLCIYCDEDGLCFPSKKTLAEKANLNTSTINRSIRQLKEAGILATSKRKRQNGSDTSSLYQLMLVE